MKQKGVLVIDFYTEKPEKAEAIAARIREAGVYAETIPWDRFDSELPKMQLESVTGTGAGIPQALVLSGSAHGVYEADAPHLSKEVFSMGFPILGICYGMQYLAQALGGSVERHEGGEEGNVPLTLLPPAQKDETQPGSQLFANLPAEGDCYMHHHDFVTKVPAGFVVTARTETCPIAAMEQPERKLYGIQFHPEVRGTAEEKRLLSNFLFAIAGCWPNL